MLKTDTDNHYTRCCAPSVTCNTAHNRALTVREIRNCQVLWYVLDSSEAYIDKVGLVVGWGLSICTVVSCASSHQNLHPHIMHCYAGMLNKKLRPLDQKHQADCWENDSCQAAPQTFETHFNPGFDGKMIHGVKA